MDDEVGVQGHRKIEVVMCAVDFSETAEVALEQAKRFARRYQATLVLAHIVEPIPLGPYPIISDPSSELAITDIARERLVGLAAGLQAEGLDTTAQTREGRPGPELVALGEEVAADLVVIGTKGLSGLKHLLLGSTAEYVVRRCEIPVLTVHQDDVILKGAIETVVLPTDLSSGAENALDYFIATFGLWQRPNVLLVHADQAPPYLEPLRHDLLAAANAPDVVREKLESEMAPAAERLRAADFEVEVLVLEGSPVTVVSELAEERGADLILLSTYGRSALANALTGRTAQRIVQTAPCPVLTIRP